MRVEHEEWKESMKKLMERRKSKGHADDNRGGLNLVRDYKLHVMKTHCGKTALDVGCGSQFLKQCLPEGTTYHGVDPFPIEGLDVVKGQIEDEAITQYFEARDIDTVYCFAVLDGCESLDDAIFNIKRIARENVVILTGIGIEKDALHTFKIEMADLDDRMHGFEKVYSENISPFVWLLDYHRIK